MSDTGSHTFQSGATRSEIKPFWSAIPGENLRRIAYRATGAPRGEALLPANGFKYEGGSRGYGYGNWRMGLPFRDTFNHVIDHLMTWKDNVEKGVLDQDDHLAAAAWGILLPLMTSEKDFVAARGEEKVQIKPRWFEALSPGQLRDAIAKLQKDVAEAQMALDRITRQDK